MRPDCHSPKPDSTDVHASLFARSPIGQTGKLPVLVPSYPTEDDSAPYVEVPETYTERLHRLYDDPSFPDQREEER